jgi:hypothetical protein
MGRRHREWKPPKLRLTYYSSSGVLLLMSLLFWPMMVVVVVVVVVVVLLLLLLLLLFVGFQTACPLARRCSLGSLHVLCTVASDSI